MRSLPDYLNKLQENNKLSIANCLLLRDMLKKVTDNLVQNDLARKELDIIMGGNILEFKGEDILKEGEARGLVEGAKKRALETARKMIKNDEPREKIIAYSGLDDEEIRRLCKALKKADLTYLLLQYRANDMILRTRPLTSQHKREPLSLCGLQNPPAKKSTWYGALK